MTFNQAILEKALKFYEIDNELYKNKCYDCLNNLIEKNAIDKFKNAFENLYFCNDEKLANLWTYNDYIFQIFENANIAYVTNVLLLFGYQIHKNNMSRDFDFEQKEIHKHRIKEILINSQDGGIRFSQLLWGIYFIRRKLIEVGRLQYENYGNGSIKIHIPAGEKLDFQAVLESLKKSKEQIKKYFKLENCDYFCDSWLLSQQIAPLLKENSNILKFQSLFEIKQGNECVEDILKFVFKQYSMLDFNLLDTETSLQKQIKKCLLQGKKFYAGCGKLKN